MISRRLLRVKALQVIYAFNRKEGNDPLTADKELELSIGKAYDLYLYLLLLLVELQSVARERIDTALNKKMPAWEDLHPNRRFADNIILECLGLSKSLEREAARRAVTWHGSAEISRVLFGRMTAWPGFAEYMRSQDNSTGSARKFVTSLLNALLLESDDLLSHLEEKSIYWNDDVDYAFIMIEKTIRKIRPGEATEIELMPLYKNEDDEKFAFHLMRNTLLKSEMTRELIDRNTTNWEIERIALMDILVMQLAITEIMVFPEVPVKVTLNEYIEIAKHYCTSKSSTFINGILDKVVKEMKLRKLFEKTGRGLVGENSEE